MKDPYSEDSLSSFLNSAYNIEYVLLILSSISQYLENEIDNLIDVQYFEDIDVSESKYSTKVENT